MTKQEEIRETMIQGVNMILLHNLVTRPKSTNCYANPEDDAKYREWLENEVDEQLRKPLHSQGVVIKVERELPLVVPEQCAVNFNINLCPLLKAGYVAVEPLIKDKK